MNEHPHVNVLNTLLEKFDQFVKWHTGIVLSYTEDQQIRMATYLSEGMLKSGSYSYQFHLDLKERACPLDCEPTWSKIALKLWMGYAPTQLWYISL